jgi:hypothetical protein
MHRSVPSLLVAGLAGSVLLAVALPVPRAEACDPRSPELIRHGNRYRIVVHGHHGSFNFEPPISFSQNDVTRLYVDTRDPGFARWVADPRHLSRGVINDVLMRQGQRAAEARGGLVRIGKTVALALAAEYLKVSRRRVAPPDVRLLRE